ncbi:MAG: hypothetical protein LBS62_00155 [Clostridiales bacterium]|jgi:hypothetical protein|nr:hypothetical protein [Clostridiales bacterium]
MLKFIRQIKELVAASTPFGEGDALRDICVALGNEIGADIAIIDDRLELVPPGGPIPPGVLAQLAASLRPAYDLVAGGRAVMVLPLVSALKKQGALIAARRADGPFPESGIAAAELCAPVAALLIEQRARGLAADESLRESRAKSILDTLSFSELEAVVHIFRILGGNGGLVVASKAAADLGIARSVIVNALRKLQSAGAVEARSLGSKGTHIKVLDKVLAREVEKLM